MQPGSGDAAHVEGAGLSVPLDKGGDSGLGMLEGCPLLRVLDLTGSRLATDPSFVGLDDARELVHQRRKLHGFTNPVTKEPGRLISDFKRVLQLVG